MVIAMANLIAAKYGPSSTIINAFLLIGFDLTARDKLHDIWQDKGLTLKMMFIIAAGGLISWVLNRNAGMIALGSTLAFVYAALVDTACYQCLRDKNRLIKVNGSNILSAATDSLVFPSVAFGSIMPAIIAGQMIAKVAGGFIWSLIIYKKSK
jgi:queuosine precursor transporter